MIKHYFRDKESKELKENNNFKQGAWIYAEDLNKEEIEKLAEEFKLEEGHLVDALDEFEVPRLETEDGDVYIFLRVPVKDRSGSNTMPFLIVLGKQFILTVVREQMSFMDKFVKNETDFQTNQKIDFLYQIISMVNNLYYRRITEINKKVRSIRAGIERIDNKDIIKFVDFEQILNDFVSALQPMSIILRSLLKGNIMKMHEDNLDSIEDLLLSSEQLLENAKSTLKNIVNIREAYSTIISQDLNRVMKLLTSLTIIVTVPTMISSFYGMNINLPFENSPFAYIGILGVTLFSVLIFIMIFKKNRWL